MTGYELPNREWIRLPEAIKFWWSACFPNLPAAADYSDRSIASLGGKDVYRAFVPDCNMTAAAYEFDCKLSEAAFAQRVPFMGKRDADDALDHEPIPFGYFSTPRGFCLNDGDIQPFPYPTKDRDTFEQAVTDRVAVWHDVLLRRSDFATWVVEAYPSCVDSIGGIANSACETIGTAPQSDPRVNSPTEVVVQARLAEQSMQPEVQSAKRVGKQPVLIKWLRQKFGGKRVPEPSFAPRQVLIREALEQIPALCKTLDPATLKKAIETYHKSLDPNRAESV